MRNRAERRHLNIKKALRKKKISDNYGFAIYNNSHYYDNLHQYSKNKIHCSCPICSAKTNNKTKRNISGNYNPSARDIRMNEALDYSLEDM